MRFPHDGVEVFVGRALSTLMVLVAVTDNGRVSDGRGSLFLSMDGGRTYAELYVGGYQGTRVEQRLTVAIPQGDDIYVVRCNQQDNMISFPTVNEGVASAHLLEGGAWLPPGDYVVNALTDGHMAKIRELEAAG